MKKLKRTILVLSSIAILITINSCAPTNIPLYRGKIEPVLDYTGWAKFFYPGRRDYMEVIALPNCPDSTKMKFFSLQELTTIFTHRDTTKFKFFTVEQVCNRFSNTPKFLLDSKIYRYNQLIMKRDSINFMEEYVKFQNSRMQNR